MSPDGEFFTKCGLAGCSTLRTSNFPSCKHLQKAIHHPFQCLVMAMRFLFLCDIVLSLADFFITLVMQKLNEKQAFRKERLQKLFNEFRKELSSMIFLIY